MVGVGVSRAQSQSVIFAQVYLADSAKSIVKKMIGSNYKLPIIVEESNELIFFPIITPDNPKCVWISLKWYDHVEIINGNTYIILKNGKKILSSASKNSVENQVLRASRLLYILNERKIVKNS